MRRRIWYGVSHVCPLDVSEDQRRCVLASGAWGLGFSARSFPWDCWEKQSRLQTKKPKHPQPVKHVAWPAGRLPSLGLLFPQGGRANVCVRDTHMCTCGYWHLRHLFTCCSTRVNNCYVNKLWGKKTLLHVSPCYLKVNLTPEALQIQ